MDNLYLNASYLETLCGPILLLAFTLNLCFEREPAGLAGVIPFKPVLVRWAIIGMSLLMVGIFLIYAFFENFGPF